MQMVLMDENAHERERFAEFFEEIVDLVATKDYNNRGESADRLSKPLRPVGRRPCPQLWQRIVVTHDGTVAMCCRDWDLYNPLGRINYPGTTIKDVWHGAAQRDARALHRQGALDEVPGCKSCTFDESYRWA
jgi:hypothetical protein